MNVPPVIIGAEHEPLDFAEYPALQDSFRAAARSFQDKKTLGLHLNSHGICPGNFIGMVWIGEGDGRAVLRVDSKFAEMDYIKMFAECAEHLEIGARVGDCLRFWADEELIETKRRDDDFLILTALAYLRELHELCRRHLRRHFMRVRQNFCGKVKGKILIGENLRQNIVRARADRIVCEFETVGDDILENRILRAALEKAARLLSRNKRAEELAAPQRWIRASRAALLGAPVSAIRRRDFIAARKRGAFAHYRRPLDLAKAVLLQLGFNPHSEISEQTQTPPFALNSAELFERYVELQLRREYPQHKIVAPRVVNVRGSGEDFNVNVRPDFYIPRDGEQEPEIIDAKYKSFSIPSEQTGENDDFYQVIAYSRHRGLLDKMQCGATGDDIKLSLAYPKVGGLSAGEIREEKRTDSFLQSVQILKIGCPAKPRD